MSSTGYPQGAIRSQARTMCTLDDWDKTRYPIVDEMPESLLFIYNKFADAVSDPILDIYNSNPIRLRYHCVVPLANRADKMG